MLEYIKSAVTRNQSEKKINSLLDFMAHSTNMKLLQVETPSFSQYCKVLHEEEYLCVHKHRVDAMSPRKSYLMFYQSK